MYERFLNGFLLKMLLIFILLYKKDATLWRLYYIILYKFDIDYDISTHTTIEFMY
jgi:hypothetical protein